MKKYFTTGLAILLPIVLTILIVTFFVNLLTNPFMGLIDNILLHYDPSYSEWLHSSHAFRLFSQLFILVFLTVLTVLVGFFGRLFLVDYLFRLGDAIFHRLPLVNKIYKATQDVAQGLFSSSSKSFSQVVFVPFPSRESLSIGLVTKESISIEFEKEHNHFVPVFVPGTPNPSVGFMLMFNRDELIFVNMKVEDAMKFIVSCGVVMSDFTHSVLPCQELTDESLAPNLS